MNFFNNPKRKCNNNCNCNRFKFTEILGLMLAVIGALIIVQILPMRIWMLLLGILMIVLGCTLFKLL